MCTMVIFDQFLSKNTLNLDKKLLKMTTVCPNCSPWRSNQEWRFICADTVIIELEEQLNLNHSLEKNHFLKHS